MCNQPCLIPAHVVTPPKSVQDIQGLTQPNDPCLQAMDPAPGKPEQVQEGTAPLVSKSTMRRQSDVSELRKERVGWHFSLQAPDLQSVHSVEAAESVRGGGDRRSHQGSATLRASKHLSSDEAKADIVSSLSHTTFGTLDGPSPSSQHISPLYGLHTLVAQEETPLSRIITGYRDGAQSLIARVPTWLVYLDLTLSMWNSFSAIEQRKIRSAK